VTSKPTLPLNRPPRKPNRLRKHKVGSWIRYYEGMERWNLDAAAHLDDYPDSKAFCLESARRFRQGVTELLIGAHWEQVHGAWS